MKKSFVAFVGAISMMGGAQAATFHLTSSGFYHYGTGGSTYGSYQEYTVDGIKLTVKAGMYTDTYYTGDSVVTQGQRGARPTPYSNGTGIHHDGDDHWWGLPKDNDHRVDGHNGNEVVMMHFDRHVRVHSVKFSYVGSKDRFDIFEDLGDDGSLQRIAQDVDIPGYGYSIVDLTSMNIAGDYFGIGASGKKHSWKLKSITVKEVPLPAALPIFLAGLAGLRWAQRRRQH